MRLLRSTLAALSVAAVPVVFVACSGGSELVTKSGDGSENGGTRGYGANGQGGDNGFGADGSGANGQGANGFGANGQGGDNGFGANGQGANGQGANGQGANGQGANGQGANGQGANGQGANGQGSNGSAAGPTNTPCNTAADCEDNNECTVDGCPQKFCVYTAKLDGTACKGGGACNFGSCASPGCGDGVLAFGEECDDGNKVDGDYCNNSCQLSTCGNGVVDGSEKCDDNNTNEFDGCTKYCQKPGTSDGLDFDPKGEGSYGVAFDDKKNIILDPTQSVAAKVKSIIWVANSGEGTVSKIDTETMTELGRYCTAPGCGGDPSRSTVSLSGDVVVANRGGGSAVFISAGTDDISCNDRNGNGKIDTSTGSTAIPWPAGQALSPDECARWWVDFRGTYGSSPLPRAAGFDAEIGTFGELSTFVYIGLFSAQKVLRINAKTGKIVKVIDVPGRPYGLVLDKEGSVWVQGGPLIKIDTKNDDKVTTYDGRCMYGIAADGLGRIYTSGGGCVGRFDPKAESWTVVTSGTSAGGIAVDNKNHVWTGSSPLVEINADGEGPMSVIGKADTGGWGVAIDKNNYPWVIPFRGNQAHRVDNKAGGSPYGHKSVAVGEGAYTYSDMTGYQLINAASRGGIFRKTFQTPCTGGSWDKVEIIVDTPDKTEIVVSVRTAADPGGLATAQFKRVATIPPDSNVIQLPADLPPGDYLGVEVAMNTKDLGKTPIMSYLAAYSKGCTKN
jgi:cysteine-rich repeat protein